MKGEREKEKEKKKQKLTEKKRYSFDNILSILCT
jgi:hypothetical protein